MLVLGSGESFQDIVTVENILGPRAEGMSQSDMMVA